MPEKTALIAEGPAIDTGILHSVDTEFYKEGDEGEMRIYHSATLSDFDIQDLQDKIQAANVTLTGPIVQSNGIIFIRFKKAQGPLAIIGGVITAIPTIIGAVLAWQLWKKVTTIPTWVWVAGAGAVLFLIFSSSIGKTLASYGGKAAIGTAKGVGRVSEAAAMKYVERRVGVDKPPKGSTADRRPGSVDATYTVKDVTPAKSTVIELAQQEAMERQYAKVVRAKG